ncbi:N-acetyltransferase family protein [Amycolatopsis sp. cg5]|uniref:GNAT family N-acetyltransferase n=1 Tax=Amycolatopsis sp. cg5 TaxID=3238802 RepID=UPI003524A889
MAQIRTAGPDDVEKIRCFGEAHIRPHYTPLIGAAAADDQVRLWWSEPQIRAAVTGGLVVVAAAGEQLVGVGQRGRRGDDHVVYKLYLDPGHRGDGLGPKLLGALIERLPADAGRLFIEHFAGNARAGAFYEREGFTVDRVEPSAGGDPALGVVWRSRPVA